MKVKKRNNNKGEWDVRARRGTVSVWNCQWIIRWFVLRLFERKSEKENEHCIRITAYAVSPYIMYKYVHHQDIFDSCVRVSCHSCEIREEVRLNITRFFVLITFFLNMIPHILRQWKQLYMKLFCSLTSNVNSFFLFPIWISTQIWTIRRLTEYPNFKF